MYFFHEIDSELILPSHLNNENTQYLLESVLSGSKNALKTNKKNNNNNNKNHINNGKSVISIHFQIFMH